MDMQFWWFEEGRVFPFQQGFSESFMRRAAEENPDVIIFATVYTTDIF